MRCRHAWGFQVLPEDNVQQFLMFLIEDISDEWMYRLATGTRWFELPR